MKCIAPILFTTLFVGASAAPDNSYDCKDEDLGDMDAYMIKKVGKTLIDREDEPFPFGKVFFADEAGAETVDGDPFKLVAQIYVEFNKDKLKDSGELNVNGDCHPLLELVGGFQEVYINVPETDEDCRANGIPVAKPFFKSENLKIRDYSYAEFNFPIDESTCFPSTKQGRVTRINVNIKGPLKADSPILTKERTIDFCYRVGYTIGTGADKEVVSFKDTKVRGQVDLQGFFGNFDTPVQIIDPVATEIDTTVSTKVEVEVSLCNNKNEYTENAQKKQYQIGQNFRLCVKSSNEKYEVEKFKDVSCGTRQLVSGGAAVDGLSEIFLLDNNGALINLSIAVKSVITATIITEGIYDGNILCQGSVTLKKKDGTADERNLQEISSGSEADDESLEIPFDLKLNLVTPNVNLNKYIESSAPLPSSITTTAVAVIGFVAALFL